MTKYEMERRAAAVEGELGGLLQCRRCKRWKDAEVIFPSSEYPYIRRHRCVDEEECRLITRQQRAANAIARQMLGQWFRDQQELERRQAEW